MLIRCTLECATPTDADDTSRDGQARDSLGLVSVLNRLAGRSLSSINNAMAEIFFPSRMSSPVLLQFGATPRSSQTNGYEVI